MTILPRMRGRTPDPTQLLTVVFRPNLQAHRWGRTILFIIGFFLIVYGELPSNCHYLHTPIHSSSAQSMGLLESCHRSVHI